MTVRHLKRAYGSNPPLPAGPKVWFAGRAAPGAAVGARPISGHSRCLSLQRNRPGRTSCSPASIGPHTGPAIMFLVARLKASARIGWRTERLARHQGRTGSRGSDRGNSASSCSPEAERRRARSPPICANVHSPLLSPTDSQTGAAAPNATRARRRAPTIEIPFNRGAPASTTEGVAGRWFAARASKSVNVGARKTAATRRGEVVTGTSGDGTDEGHRAKIIAPNAMPLKQARPKAKTSRRTANNPGFGV